MAYTEARRRQIFTKSDGHCHLCGKKLAWKNYGIHGARGAWHVEHSKPRAKGGTDHLNNLWPGCISCNLDKGTNSTKSARSVHGRKGAPLSATQKKSRRQDNAVAGGAVGGLGVLALGATGPIGAAAALLGALIGHDVEPDPQRGKRRRKRASRAKPKANRKR